MKLYKVTFTFVNSYSVKAEGFVSIELAVFADDQFKAQATAWDKLATLNLPEPKSYAAERITL